jgi:SPP1 gp7 family putative phage head morphogenesis protein
MDASLSSQANILLNKLFRGFEDQFKNQGQRYAERMVNDVDKVSVSTLHSSLQKLSGGLSIKTDFLTGDLKEILKATIYENVGLIVTIPQTYLGQVRGIVMRSIIEPANEGLAGVIKDLDKLLDMRSRQIKNKAKNLALDQVRKTYNNLNKGRMEKYGLTKFEWVHSGGGQEPRELHRDVLNGQIFSFDDLPIIEAKTGERGIPGQAINCRCTMFPVIEFDNGVPE